MLRRFLSKDEQQASCREVAGQCGMEAPPARDHPAPCTPGPPSGQASPRLTLGPIFLPPEQGLAPTVFLKALPLPLYHTVPPGGLQPRVALAPGGLDGASLPFILSPLLQPEGPGPAQVAKPPAPVLTLNLVGALPVLSPGLGPPLGSPGKVRSAGRYLCPHCARDCLKPSVLEKHIRSHTGERPFPCATCGISFKTQSNLYKHRRTQTHLNNSRRSSESDGGSASLLDQGDRAGETPRADGSRDGRSQSGGDEASERPPSRGHCLGSTAQLALVAERLDVKPEAAPCAGSMCADGDAIGPQPWRKPLEQKSPTASKPCPLQRQQATTWEKAWEAKGSEGRLRKCESSDSGYLSRSDSAEQPPVPASPLHSLSEHSAEGQGGPGPGERAAALEQEKKRLEERIARLISHNQAVVDDPQLDTVRPRKTVLSKQGSLDLPRPYTYKDSFHFNMHALEPGRRRPATLGSARSTCPPPDKARPLSFHSVPTQLSTTAKCVSVTRSNSLPFVDSTRTWQDPREACPQKQRLLNSRPTPVLSAVPSTHPRALVRQAAVEDLSGTTLGESPILAEDHQRTTAGEGAANRGRVAGKRGSQRKLKMFSQEKWQVYGDETFKRIYQKGKTSTHRGKKAGEVRVDPPPQVDTVQAEAMKTPTSADLRTPICRDVRTPVCGDSRTTICRDVRTPICGDARTPVCGDVRTPTSICGDTRTPICGDVRTPVCGDLRTTICRDVRTSICGDARTPVCGDMRTPISGDTRTPIGRDVRTPICGDSRTLICGDVKTPICGDARTPVCGDAKTPVCGDAGTPACGDAKTPVCGDVRTPVCRDVLPPVAISSGAEPGSWGGQVTPEFSMVAEPRQARSGGSDEAGVNGAVAPSILTCKDPPFLGCKSPQLPPNERPELGGELSLGPGPLRGGDPGAPKQEGVSCGDGGGESRLWAQSTARPPSSVPGQAPAMGDRLPSERKKLKVEGLGGQGQSEPLGMGHERGGSLESPTQAASLPAWGLDNEPAEKPGGLPPSADRLGRGSNAPLESIGASWTSSLAILRQAGPRGKGPPLHPAAVSPGCYPQAPDRRSFQLAALPRAPDSAFTPKYLLRLPQGETPSELPSAKGHGQGQDPLCKGVWPEERAPFVRSGRETHLSPGPASGRTPEEADSITKDPDWFRARDGVEGARAGKGGEERVATRPLGAQDLASITPTPTPGSCSAWDTELEDPAFHPLCSGRVSVRARPPGGAPNPWPSTWEKASEDPRSGPLAQLSLSCASQPGPFLSAITRPPSWPELALPPHSGNPRSGEAEGPFPSLKAEPRLTWCCLSRSLPLPAEQKEKTSSVYLSLHLTGGGPRDEALEGRIRTSQGDSGPAQMSKLSCPIAPGVTSQDWVSEPEQRKGLPRRRAKTSRGISRQKKLRINPKRYKGAFLQSRAQPRASRLCKPHWVLRGGCHPHPHEGRDPCKALQPASSETAGLNPQGEPSGATSQPSRCCGNKEKNEDDGRRISVTLAPSTSPSNVRKIDNVAVKDISPSAGEHGNCFSQSSLQSDPCLAVGKDHFPPCCKGLDVGLLKTQLLLPAEHVSVDPKSGIFADAQGPSSFESEGTLPRHDAATSVAAVGTSLGVTAGHMMLGIPSAEPQGCSWSAEETVLRSSPGRKTIADGTSLPCLPEKPSSGQRISGAAPLESTEKAHLEIPASGLSPTSSHQEEGRHQGFFPSRGQYKCGEKVTPCHPLGNKSEKCQVPGSTSLKDCVVPCSSGQPTDIPEAPSKTIKKRSLEGMRKQTRLEFSDTSSDDEDRLVIEI
ncbi:zinc finger protein 831 [Trichechus manatus latirostris]|uniref:Zinc finger protein 831 n=1 Tax=Trichechus manatus latirostris TaxID=127582 RepID=A0A2Y9S200_TRIMA|nr:zinc finger protein 831 [Trichechus manatus latirostris]